MPVNSWTRYLIGVLAMLLIGFFVYRFSNIVAYVLAAWVLSLIGSPLVRMYRRIKIGRLRVGVSAAALLTILTFFLVGGLFLLLFIPLIIKQANNLAHVDYLAIAGTLEVPFNRLIHWLSQYGVTVPADSLEGLVQRSLKGWFEPNRLSHMLTQAVTAVGNTLVNVFSTIFITFFFLQERRLFMNFILAITPEAYEEPARETMRDTVLLLSRYFRGILLQITIITVYVSVFLTILGVKNALLIGFFAAIMNMIPYLGPLFGGAFGIFITLSSNLELDFYTEMLPLLGKVLGVFITVQWLDNYFLSPTIFSKSVLAHPLEIFLVVLMGANVAGVVGMVLAIPAYTIFRVFAKEFLHQFKIVQKMTDRMKQSGI
ncbi:MAG: AI-2E family transporter [Haliscomenobacter sp.]|nr:AI-2E family transporter [Haliscomenobacter sp.]MBP9077018.1 AI-2E family transporter [Haliscomenobacter sp.]MBP9874880.1 AI-2E family transporter [Haliscomenobacter sp.]